MASKYSNYELKPYVSTYTNPYSVEVNTLLRERYDSNKAKVDLIDQTLGAKQTLEGDRVHVENAKGMVKNRFTNLTEVGDYENAGLVVSEVVNQLESDRGLKLAQQSYLIRQDELKHIREARINGMNMLDFGLGKVNEHQSYYQDNEGAWIENVYEPLTEKEHLYHETIAQLVGTIKSDASGISRGKANRVAADLLDTYIDGFVGDQHFRKLTQIEGMSEQDARATILEEIQSITSKQIHNLQVKSDLSGSKSLLEYLSGKGASPDGSSTFSLNNGDVGNFIIDMNRDIFDADFAGLSEKEKATTERLSRETFYIEKGVVAGLLEDADINQEDYNNHMQYGINGYGNHYKFRNLVNHYLSTEVSSFDKTLQGDINRYTNTGISIGTTATIALARRLQGKKMNWRAKTMLLAGTFLSAELFSQADRAFDTQSNVRTNTSSVSRLINGNSELEQLMVNLQDVDYLASRGVVNPNTGEAYNHSDPEYQALLEVAKANYRYRTELGGDDVYSQIENYSGNIFTSDVIAPNTSEEGKSKRTTMNSEIAFFNPHKYNWLLLDEDSDAWKATFFENPGEDDQKMHDVMKTGYIPGSFESGIPGYIQFQIKGKENIQYAEDKPTATGLGLTEVEQGLMLLNHGEDAAHTHAAKFLEKMEKYSESTIGETGGVTRQDQINQLAESFAYVMNTYDGEQNIVQPHIEGMAFADSYMKTQFHAAHPNITMDIMQSLGYGDVKTVEEVPQEIIDELRNEVNRRYQQYLTLEIRRFN